MLRLLREKFNPPADPTHLSFAGRTVLVTGASAGLGLEAAVKIAAQGAATLVLGVRDARRGEAAKRTIERRAAALQRRARREAVAEAAKRKRVRKRRAAMGRNHDDGSAAAAAGATTDEDGDGDGGSLAAAEVEGGTNVLVWQLDMASFASVRAFAARVQRELPGGVDAAILNAGVQKKAFERVAGSGWEETLQVNTLATALLGALLLPALRKRTGAEPGRPPVLEIVGSSLYRRGLVQVAKKREQLGDEGRLLEAFNVPEGYKHTAQYSRSKTFVMFAMLSLAGLDKYTRGGKDVVVLAASPGFCKSTLGREHVTNWFTRIAAKIFFGIFGRETEEGARSLVSGIGLGEEAHGGFWHSDKLLELDPLLLGELGESMRQQVWNEILDAVRKEVPEVLEVVRSG